MASWMGYSAGISAVSRAYIPYPHRLAAALACLLPQDVRDDLRKRRVDPKEVEALFEDHHIKFYALDPDNHWSNLHPMLRAEHKERTRKDIGAIAKTKRLARATAEAQARLLAKEPGRSARPKSKWPQGRKMQSRNTFKDRRR